MSKRDEISPWDERPLWILEAGIYWKRTLMLIVLYGIALHSFLAVTSALASALTLSKLHAGIAAMALGLVRLSKKIRWRRERQILLSALGERILTIQPTRSYRNMVHRLRQLLQEEHEDVKAIDGKSAHDESAENTRFQNRETALTTLISESARLQRDKEHGELDWLLMALDQFSANKEEEKSKPTSPFLPPKETSKQEGDK